jgi:hypothetical protein
VIVLSFDTGVFGESHTGFEGFGKIVSSQQKLEFDVEE